MLIAKWDSYIDRFSDEEKDIYFHENYVYAQASKENEPICFVYEDREKCFLCPFLKGRVPWLDEPAYDVETPYGYGGPIVNTKDSGFIARAAAQMEDDLRHQGVIAGFFRFHPLLGNHNMLEKNANVDLVPLRETVVIDLSISEESLWIEQMHGKHRNAIRQAQRFGLEFYLDEDLKYLEDFCCLYAETMRRIGADDFYFFEKSYFQRLFKLGQKLFLGVVLKDGKCIAAAIFMHNGPYAHYHLSASIHDALKWRPNNFMVYEASLILKKRGALWLHLGGGEDGVAGKALFQFKSRFSKLRREFIIGKAVFEKKKYFVLFLKD